MGPPLWSVEIFSDENIIFPPGADILKPSRVTSDVAKEHKLTHSCAGTCEHPSLTRGTPLGRWQNYDRWPCNYGSTITDTLVITQSSSPIIKAPASKHQSSRKIFGIIMNKTMNIDCDDDLAGMLQLDHHTLCHHSHIHYHDLLHPACHHHQKHCHEPGAPCQHAAARSSAPQSQPSPTELALTPQTRPPWWIYYSNYITGFVCVKKMITTNLDIKHQKIYFWVVQGKQEGEEGKALGKLLQYDSSDQQKYKSQTKERFQL